jgi:DNA polymerase III delta subunit
VRLSTDALLARASSDDLPVSLYVDGPSEPLKAAVLAEIRHAWAAACPESPRAHVHRAADGAVDEVLAAWQGGSLFAPRDLVIVLDVEDLGRSEKKIAALAEGLSRPAGASCLLLVESAADTTRKSLDALRAACAARWTAEVPARAELAAWAARRLAHERITAEAGVVPSLLDSCESEPLAFFNELEKLVVLAGSDGRLTEAEARERLRPVVEGELARYLAAVAQGNAGAAARGLGRLLAAGESEGTVLFALGNLVSGALGGWSRHRELSAALGRRRPRHRLPAALDAVYRAEMAWKSGRLDAVAALEQATREVAAG